MKVILLDGAGFSPPYDFNLAKGLEAAGASVRLVMPESVREEWASPDGSPTGKASPAVRVFQRGVKAAAYVALLNNVRRMVHEWRPDVLHVQWLPLPLVDNPFLRAVGGSVPLVHTMHNTSLFHGSGGGVQGWGLASALTRFQRVVVHSEYSRRAALGLGLVRDESVRVIPHGAFDYYQHLGGHGRIPQADAMAGPVRLLFVGSIKAYKGLDVLVESLATLDSLTPKGSWTLTIAGQPGMPMEPHKKAVEEMGLQSQVTWHLRHQSERELGTLLVESDVVVLPYREIDQSGVLLAAIGVERPVVATRVGAFPELLRHEEHGLLVPPEDPLALGTALARMVTDNGLRAHCAAQIKNLTAGVLAWSTIGRATLDMYRELTSS